MSEATTVGLADIRTRINAMKGHVAQSFAALAELNVMPAGSARLENLPQTIEQLAAGTTVAGILNPTGSDYQLPHSQKDRDALLANAKIIVRNEDNEILAEAGIPGLVNSVFYAQVPGITAKTSVTVSVVFGNDTYTCPAIRTYLVPERITSCAFASKASIADKEEIGRFQFKDDNSGLSYLIRRVTRADGTFALHFGGWYLDKTGAAVWQNHSGLFTTVKSCPDEASEVVESVVNACSDAGARNLMDTLKVFREMTPVTAVSTDAKGVEVVNKLMRYSKFYCKTEETELVIPTYNEDGTVAALQAKKVVIKWMADEKIDESYHAHAFFVRTEREGTTFKHIELDHAYYSRYPVNWMTVAPTASTTTTVATCTPDGICPTTALDRNKANAYARDLNKLKFKLTLDETGETIAEFAANADPRAWATSSSHDISFFQWICVMLYGTEIQTVIMGNCTEAGSNPQTKNGATDWLFNKGILFGSANNASNTQPCVIAGIEDGIHSSQGTFMEDLTYFAERIVGEGGMELKRAFMVYAPDRLDWTPMVGTYEELIANGYRELSFEINTNTDPSNTTISNPRRRFGMDEGVGARDLMIPCADQNEPNFCQGAVDNFWLGTTNDVGVAGKKAYLVALGAHRNIGRSLGLFTVYASHALGHALATYWRPRLSLQVVGA